MSIRTLLRRLIGRTENNRDFFGRVFEKNAWGGIFSRSGTGSEGQPAKQKVEVLTDLLNRYGIRTVLDIGCGDFYWMRELVDRVDCYLGLDIVPRLVENNRARYGSEKVDFRDLDLTRETIDAIGDERRWDLVVCVDVIGHLSNAEVSSLLQVLVRDLNFRYLLLTNRRDAQSLLYLTREKTRHEGIDIEKHPVFLEAKFVKLLEVPALYPGDTFNLYKKEF